MTPKVKIDPHVLRLSTSDCGPADRDRAEEAGHRRVLGPDRAARAQGAVGEGGGGDAAQRLAGV